MELSDEIFSDIAGVGIIEPVYELEHERRKHPRVAFGSRARISPLFDGMGSRGVSVMLRDISKAGVGFLSPKRLDCSDEFVLHLRSKSDKPLLIHCLVSHCEPGGTGCVQFVIGATFEQIIDASTLADSGPAMAEVGVEAAPVEQATEVVEEEKRGPIGRLVSPVVGLCTGLGSLIGMRRNNSRLRSRLRAEARITAAEAPPAEAAPKAPAAPANLAPTSTTAPVVTPGKIIIEANTTAASAEPASPPRPRANSIFRHEEPVTPANPETPGTASDTPATSTATTEPGHIESQAEASVPTITETVLPPAPIATAPALTVAVAAEVVPTPTVAPAQEPVVSVPVTPPAKEVPPVAIAVQAAVQEPAPPAAAAPVVEPVPVVQTQPPAAPVAAAPPSPPAEAVPAPAQIDKPAVAPAVPTALPPSAHLAANKNENENVADGEPTPIRRTQTAVVDVLKKRRTAEARHPRRRPRI